jgi:hypothetical protein
MGGVALGAALPAILGVIGVGLTYYAIRRRRKRNAPDGHGR